MNKTIGIATFYQIRVNDGDTSLCGTGDNECGYLVCDENTAYCAAFDTSLYWWNRYHPTPVRCSDCHNADEVDIDEDEEE
jgi:hypothetical protein